MSDVIHDDIGNQGAPTGAADPALYIIDDDTEATRVTPLEVHEMQQNWYLAFFFEVAIAGRCYGQQQ